MYIYILSGYGIFATLIGLASGQFELAAVGLVALLVGNLHLAGRILLYLKRRNSVTN